MKKGAVKGRKVTGTVTPAGDSTGQKITFTYNKKGVLTSYTTTESGYAPEKTTLKNGIRSNLKVSNKKYTAGKVLKSARVTITPWINGEGGYYEETYYTSGKQKGLIKTRKEYYTDKNGTTLYDKNSYKYTVDSHGNVTKVTITTSSPQSPFDNSRVTTTTVITMKYKKLTLKK